VAVKGLNISTGAATGLTNTARISGVTNDQVALTTGTALSRSKSRIR
jgi:hypothetical protein